MRPFSIPGVRFGRVAASAAVGASLLAGVLAQAPAAHAWGDFSWCWDDPVVSINGMQLQTLVGAYGDPTQVAATVSSASVVYTLPSNVTGSVVSVQNTYFKETVGFTHSKTKWTPGTPLPVTVQVYFNSSVNYTVQQQDNEGSTTVGTASGTAWKGTTTTVYLR